MLHEFNDFAATLEQLGQGRQRVMRIGAVPQAFATFLPQAMRHFREWGGCAVRIEEATARQLLAMLTAAPRRAAALREALGAVKIVPMTEPIALMQVGFVHRRSSRDDAAVGLFRDCLLQAVHESQDT